MKGTGRVDGRGGRSDPSLSRASPAELVSVLLEVVGQIGHGPAGLDLHLVVAGEISKRRRHQLAGLAPPKLCVIRPTRHDTTHTTVANSEPQGPQNWFSNRLFWENVCFWKK